MVRAGADDIRGFAAHPDHAAKDGLASPGSIAAGAAPGP